MILQVVASNRTWAAVFMQPQPRCSQANIVNISSLGIVINCDESSSLWWNNSRNNLGAQKYMARSKTHWHSEVEITWNGLQFNWTPGERNLEMAPWETPRWMVWTAAPLRCWLQHSVEGSWGTLFTLSREQGVWLVNIICNHTRALACNWFEISKHEQGTRSLC